MGREDSAGSPAGGSRSTVHLIRAQLAAEAAVAARRARDEAIREAARHHSYREIADAVGLSKPRVQQIVREGGER